MNYQTYPDCEFQVWRVGASGGIHASREAEVCPLSLIQSEEDDLADRRDDQWSRSVGVPLIHSIIEYVLLLEYGIERIRIRSNIPETARCRLIGQVPADTWQVHKRRDTNGRQVAGVADARVEEDLGGTDDTSSKENFLCRGDSAQRAAVDVLGVFDTLESGAAPSL